MSLFLCLTWFFKKLWVLICSNWKKILDCFFWIVAARKKIKEYDFLKKENEELKKEVAQLQLKLDPQFKYEELLKDYEFIATYKVYFKKPFKGIGEQAYCPNCIHELKQAVPLALAAANENEKWHCGICNKYFASNLADERHKIYLQNLYENSRRYCSTTL